jgi:hypothetical protein
MAAIIRHFRSAGEGACLFGISKKKARYAQLPHLRPSFAENKFNEREKISKTRGQTPILGNCPKSGSDPGLI